MSSSIYANGDANNSFGIPVNAGNVGSPGAPVNAQQLQQQRNSKQRMLLQQRALQQQKHQQAMQNYESQFYQLLMTLLKIPIRL